MRDVILSSSVLIPALLAMKVLLKGKISAKLQYALWILVVVRLIVPGTIGSSPISVQRLVQFPAESVNDTDTLDIPAADTDTQTIGNDMADGSAGISVYLNGDTEGNAFTSAGTDVQGNIFENTDAGTINGGVTADADINRNADDNIDGYSHDNQAVNAAANMETNLLFAPAWKNVIYGIWILGIMITGGYMLLYQIRLARYLSAHRKPLQKKNGKYRGLKVYTVEGLPSPCLCGKRIYLAGEIAADDRRLNHILAHEYCHYRQLDPFWAVIRCILVSVYWFHPLVWAAAYASKQDSELACDEAAISLLGEEERYDYGRTLLGLICKKSSAGLGIGPVLTMGSSEKRMRERIGRIAQRPKNLILAGVLVLVFAVVISVITFTGTRQETESVGLMMVDSETGTILIEADLTDMLNDSEALEEEINRILEELKEKQTEAAEQAMQESASVIAQLSSYDEMLLPVKGEGREGEIRNLPGAIVRKPSELWEDYLSQGEDAIIEGLYLLASWNGREGQSMPQSVSDEVEDIISVYGLYTKEYGLRGVKIMVGEGMDKDANNFDIPWSFLGVSRIHAFENDPGDETAGGLPRTFVFKQLMPGSETSYINYGAEVYELYLCDRYDTGHIELSKVSEGDFVLQIKNRISCKVNQEKQEIYVYDNGTLVGTISTAEISAMDPYQIKEAVIDTDHIDFVLGSKIGYIRLSVPIVLQTITEDNKVITYFPALPFIDFPIDCGYFGPDREFTLGKAEVDIAHVAIAITR